MTDASNFAGLRALVTGGSSGLGRAIASTLVERGAAVAVLDIQAAPSRDVTYVECDVVDDASVSRAVREAAEVLGGVDVLVNNAGIGAQGRVEENLDAEWRSVFEVNVFGLVRVTRAALPYLRKSSCAVVVNMCSVAATTGLPDRALYSASKGAVLSLTLAMAADLVGESIRVNCVNPGTADTPWVERLLADADDPIAEKAALAARQPHGRLVSAYEVANAVAYLVDPRSGSTSGTSLAVDGGMARLRTRQPLA